MESEFEKDPTAKELAKEFFDKPLIDRFYTNVGEYIFNHQQSKIDELTKQRDSFIKAYEIEMDKSIELQKRVDAAQKLIDDWNFGGVHIFDLLDELEQALKGGEA